MTVSVSLTLKIRAQSVDGEARCGDTGVDECGRVGSGADEQRRARIARHAEPQQATRHLALRWRRLNSLCALQSVVSS